MKKNILLLVTGSVAAFKAAALASKLAQAGFDVQTVLSSGAKEFVGAATFEGLTRGRVYASTFAPGDAMAHIDLARWADLTLIYPASGNTLTKLAMGRADDLIGTLFLAHDFKSPYWIAPAMNPSMLSHPAVAEAVAKLRRWGVTVLDSDDGRMACGEVGTGRLIEPEAMVSEIERHFGAVAASSTNPSKTIGKRILVTAGGTTEAIDPVRVLTNVSTGETGVRIANTLTQNGNDVTLLLAGSSPFQDEVLPGVRVIPFRSYEDLDGAMKKELGSKTYDVLIHAAAVSDFRVSRMETGQGAEVSGMTKIQSNDPLVLHLSPNPKILNQVRGYAGKKPLRVISFKLADSPNADLSGYDSDVVIYNQISGVERGSDRHAGEIFERRAGKFSLRSRFKTKSDLTTEINGLVNS
jgi:phosphopantothenoylcysteine decarboxylase/phosphopantothenate--cysteine ligase